MCKLGKKKLVMIFYTEKEKKGHLGEINHKKIGHKALPGKAGLGWQESSAQAGAMFPLLLPEQTTWAGAIRHSPDSLGHTSVTPGAQQDTAFIQISSPAPSFF